MHREAATGPVVGRIGDERELAEQIRRDLLNAGVTRYELHHASNDPPREWMRMHDLRTTGITWMAVRGGDPLAIMARAGHQDMETTMGYVSQAALVRRGYGVVFPDLPAELVESSRESSRSAAICEETGPKAAEAHGNRRDRPTRAYVKRPRLSVVPARGVTRDDAAKCAELRGGDDSRDEWTPARIERVQRLLEAAKRAASRGDTGAFWRLWTAAGEDAPRATTENHRAKSKSS